jgi:hypothetical protein
LQPAGSFDAAKDGAKLAGVQIPDRRIGVHTEHHRGERPSVRQVREAREPVARAIEQHR